MRKKPHDWILRGEPKEYHLSTVPKFSHIYIYIYYHRQCSKYILKIDAKNLI